MAILKGIWNTVRGVGLLLLLSFIIGGVVTVSCLARLLLGTGGMPDYAGRFHLSS